MRLIEPGRPLEFRLIAAVPFVGLFVGLMIALAVLYVKSRYHGMFQCPHLMQLSLVTITRSSFALHEFNCTEHCPRLYTDYYRDLD